MNTDSPRIPDILLERYRLGELDPDQAGLIEKRLRTDAALRQRLADLDQSDRDILERYRPADMAEGIRVRLRERPARERSRRLPLFGLSAAAAAACAVMFLILVVPGLKNGGNGFGPEPPEVVRAKGDPAARTPALSVYRQNPSGAELLKDGAVVLTRDTVQLRYEAAGRRFGVILSIDGRGAITIHFPLPSAASNELQPGSVLLENAFELDDVPDFEKFYFVTAESAFDPALVTAAARRLVTSGRPVRENALPLPAEFAQTSVLLVKEKR